MKTKTQLLVMLMAVFFLCSCSEQKTQLTPVATIETEIENDVESSEDDSTENSITGGKALADRVSTVWQITYENGLFEKNMNVGFWLFADKTTAQANLTTLTTKPIKKGTFKGNGVALFKSRTMPFGSLIIDGGPVIGRYYMKLENTGTKPFFWFYRGTKEGFIGGSAKLKIKPKTGQLFPRKTVWIPVNTPIKFDDWIKDNPDPLEAPNAHIMILNTAESVGIPAGNCMVLFTDGTDTKGTFLAVEPNKTITLKPTF
jgi:hypothetical protein